jgi:hypothetical protein
MRALQPALAGLSPQQSKFLRHPEEREIIEEN